MLCHAFPLTMEITTVTDAERRLLLLIANVFAGQLEEEASEKHGDTDNAATEIRSLIEQVRPK